MKARLVSLRSDIRMSLGWQDCVSIYYKIIQKVQMKENRKVIGDYLVHNVSNITSSSVRPQQRCKPKNSPIICIVSGNSELLQHRPSKHFTADCEYCPVTTHGEHSKAEH